MGQYRTCEGCGATLDPGERCDCEKEKSACERTLSNAGKSNISNARITLEEAGVND